ncbi:MAG: hypothetical protein IM638_01715 [Bacteroidetes bacterium]|nr:hypothetical protein [Bacteroidota bacterium]
MQTTLPVHPANMKLTLTSLLLLCLFAPMLHAQTGASPYIRALQGTAIGHTHQFPQPAQLQISTTDSAFVLNATGYRAQPEGAKGKLLRETKDSLVFQVQCGFRHYANNPEMEWHQNLGVMDPEERRQAKPPYFRAGGDTLYIGFRLFHATLPDTFIIHLSDTEKLVYTAQNRVVVYNSPDSSMGEVKLSLKGKKSGKFRTYPPNDSPFYCMLEFRMPHNNLPGEFLVMRGEELAFEIVGENTVTSFLLRKDNGYKGNVWLFSPPRFYMTWQVMMESEKK